MKIKKIKKYIQTGSHTERRESIKITLKEGEATLLLLALKSCKQRIDETFSDVEKKRDGLSSFIKKFLEEYPE